MGNEHFWRITTRVVLFVVAALFGVLVATGVALTTRYRPGPDGVRTAHQAATYLFMLAGIVLAISAITLFGIRRRWVLSVFPILAGILTLATLITGALLPWDQLALRRVTVGQSFRGYGKIVRGDTVRYVIIGNSEIDLGAFRLSFWLHTVLLPLALGLIVFLIARAVTRASVQPGGSEVGPGAQAPELLPHD